MPSLSGQIYVVQIDIPANNLVLKTGTYTVQTDVQLLKIEYPPANFENATINIQVISNSYFYAVLTQYPLFTDLNGTAYLYYTIMVPSDAIAGTIAINLKIQFVIVLPP